MIALYCNYLVSTPINGLTCAVLDRKQTEIVFLFNSDFDFDGHSHVGPSTRTKHTVLRKKMRQAN